MQNSPNRSRRIANPSLNKDERNMSAMRMHMIAEKIFFISRPVLFLNVILISLSKME